MHDTFSLRVTCFFGSLKVREVSFGSGRVRYFFFPSWVQICMKDIFYKISPLKFKRSTPYISYDSYQSQSLPI